MIIGLFWFNLVPWQGPISNNSTWQKSFICKRFEIQTVPFDPYTRHYQILSLWVKVDQRAMAMEATPHFPNLHGRPFHHQIV